MDLASHVDVEGRTDCRVDRRVKLMEAEGIKFITSANVGVTISMADRNGPFDYHLTRQLVGLCAENDIIHQKDVFRHYRSDVASAVDPPHVE